MKTSQSDVSPAGMPDSRNSTEPDSRVVGNGFRWRQLWTWLLILGSISILTSDWMLFHAIILFSVGPSLIGASMSKRGSYLWPFTIALCISLSIAVFGHSFLSEIGVADFLPRLMGQGSTK